MTEKSETALGTYPWFIERLKHPSSQDFVNRLTLFTEKFPTAISRFQASELFIKFLVKAEMKAATLPAFADASEEQIAAGLEKFLVKLLEEKLTQSEDSVMDKIVFEKMCKMADKMDLVRHLKGPKNFDRSLLDAAVKELSSLDRYRAPKDKLQCFLNAHKIIKFALEISAKSWGAEELLPVTIYTVVMARPRKLVSDVNWIRFFTKPEKLAGEIDYVLTQLEMTVEFIGNFDLKLLTRLTDEQRNRLAQINTKYIDRSDISMLELPELIAEAQEMDKLLVDVGLESDLDLSKMKIDQILDLIQWYMKTAEFIVKLKNLVYSICAPHIYMLLFLPSLVLSFLSIEPPLPQSQRDLSPVQSRNESLKTICPRKSCDDLTLLKIRDQLENVQCSGCKLNLAAFLCHAVCGEKQDFFAFPVNPVFCAAGQLSCADASFCRRDGLLAKFLSAVSGTQAAVTVANDFSLMPLSAECHENSVPSPQKTIQEKSKIWMFVVGGVILGAWLSHRFRKNEKRKREAVWMPVEPEESTRLYFLFSSATSYHKTARSTKDKFSADLWK